MEYKNLASGSTVTGESRVACQKYWVGCEQKGNPKRNSGVSILTVYKGSFPSKEKRIMTCNTVLSKKDDAGNCIKRSFFAGFTQIAEVVYKNEYELRTTGELKDLLFPIPSIMPVGNVTGGQPNCPVTVQPYVPPSLAPNEVTLAMPTNFPETAPMPPTMEVAGRDGEVIAKINVKTSGCSKALSVVADPYFKSVKAYPNPCTCMIWTSGMICLISLILTLAFAVLKMKTAIVSAGLLFFLSLIIANIAISCHPCKLKSRDRVFQLVGIEDNEKYADICLVWRTCSEFMSTEIICYRDIDLPQLLALIEVAVEVELYFL